MSLGSTHDSKRSEDVRARIAAISEYPAEWADLITRLNPLAASLPAPIDRRFQRRLERQRRRSGRPRCAQSINGGRTPYRY